MMHNDFRLTIDEPNDKHESREGRAEVRKTRSQNRQTRKGGDFMVSDFFLSARHLSLVTEIMEETFG